MRRALILGAMLACALAPPSGAARDSSFHFSVLAPAFKGGADEAALRHALAEAGAGNPAFVLATGLKDGNEPCSDSLYGARRALYNASEAPLVLSLAGSDWSACLNSAGRSNAIERLNRLRDLFFADASSLGTRRLALNRLSASAKFRSYAENAHWQVGKVLFATINLPAANNHYRPEAGRNSEYEDRLVANRAWLHRLFTLAERNAMEGMVLFSDGDLGLPQDDSWSLLPHFRSGQDGFAEPRRQVQAMAQQFRGKLLLVDTQGVPGSDGAIIWRGNLGHLSLAADGAQIRVAPGSATLFAVRGSGSDTPP